MRPIYLDNNATTPLDPAVLDAMLPFLKQEWGNPMSNHIYGWNAEVALEEAREQVAHLIGAHADEIFFTSGATEANNWFIREHNPRGRTATFTSPIEHKSVLEPVKALPTPVHLFPVDGEGVVQFDAVPGPGSVVTLMAVNNEIHTLLDLEATAQLCQRHGAVFHCDATQAVGRIPLNVRALGIDALSMAAHKLYGPKGIGALYLARQHHALIAPLLRGGGQERGLRGGTTPVALAVGFGVACERAAGLEAESRRLRRLAQSFLDGLTSRGLSVQLIGPADLGRRQPGGLSLNIEGLPGSQLCELAPDLIVSQGSACTSNKTSNHVLAALGISAKVASQVIRLSFGRFNDDADAELAASRIAMLTDQGAAPRDR